MIILFCDLTSNQSDCMELRAAASADRMRRRVLKEIDWKMGAGWRRTHVCNLFVCQLIDGRIYMNPIIEGLWETRPRRGAFIRAYLNQKSALDLSTEERRLALALAFHPRLGVDSLLGGVDLLVLETIMWFAGPCLM